MFGHLSVNYGLDAHFMVVARAVDVCCVSDLSPPVVCLWLPFISVATEFSTSERETASNGCQSVEDPRGLGAVAIVRQAGFRTGLAGRKATDAWRERERERLDVMPACS